MKNVIQNIETKGSPNSPNFYVQNDMSFIKIKLAFWDKSNKERIIPGYFKMMNKKTLGKKQEINLTTSIQSQFQKFGCKMWTDENTRQN